MVLDTQPRLQLVNRRMVLRRFWKSNPEKRRRATQAGFAKALETSTTAVNNFEQGERDDFPNGKGVNDYMNHLEGLEREARSEKSS